MMLIKQVNLVRLKRQSMIPFVIRSTGKSWLMVEQIGGKWGATLGSILLSPTE
jgi:hypothetical protein